MDLSTLVQHVVEGVCGIAEGILLYIGSLEGLVVVTRISPVAKHLTDVAVRPLVAGAAVVGGVRRRIGKLRLRGTVLCVVEVETVADVAEEARRRFLFGFRLG